MGPAASTAWRGHCGAFVSWRRDGPFSVSGKALCTRRSRTASAIVGSQLALEKLRDLFGDGFVVRSQLPLALDADSEPEPDVAVVVGSVREFVDAHPVTAVLVVEVADTSLAFDRTTKAAVYARTGIADYWIVNLVDRVVEVHRDPQTAMPSGSRFASVQVLRNGDVIAPLARPDRRIAVADLLP